MRSRHAAAAALIAISGVVASSSGAQQSAPGGAHNAKYPLVAQHSPNVPYLISNYPDAAALMLARYDALVTNRTGFTTEYAAVWDEALTLNPDLVIILQIPLWSAPACDSIGPILSEMAVYLDGLGERKSLIDAVEVDGSGNVAKTCGQSVLLGALTNLKASLGEHGVSPILTINGAGFPDNVPGCRYKAAFHSSGPANSKALPPMLNGTLEEGWIAKGLNQFHYYGMGAGLGDKGLDLANSRVREACSWVSKARQPSHVILTHDNVETPWWNLYRDSSILSWNNMRAGFAAAQMYDDLLFIHNPTNSGVEDRQVNPERLFWGDYYAVNMTTGKPPTYGPDKVKSYDDALVSQRASGGYLGAPSSKAKVTAQGGGSFMEREFACAFVYANLSPLARKVTPGVATRKVLGFQDRKYDNGRSQRSYTVPAGDGLVLLKERCIG